MSAIRELKQRAAAPAAPTRRPLALARKRAGDWSPDIGLLALLLALTAVFGRPFSKLGVAHEHVYVTELALVATTVLALARTGVRGAFNRIRSTIPVVALLVFWFAGAIATVRGLHAFGLSLVVHDVGLVEYSVFLPLVAVVVDTRERATMLLRALSWAGIAATLLYAFVYEFDPTVRIGPVQNPSSAVGIYVALFALPVLGRAALGLALRPWEIVVAATALVTMALVVTRGVTLALLIGLAVIVVAAGRRSRLRASAVAAAALVCSIAGGVIVPHLYTRIAEVNPVAPLFVADPDFVASDGRMLTGGSVVRGDAAYGELSREVQIGHALEIPIGGLDPGVDYTVMFAVKPLAPSVTTGVIGNTAGTGWGMRRWTAAPLMRWQEFRKRLRATLEVERLVFVPDGGAPAVGFDGLRVLRGWHRGPSGDFRVQRSVARPNFISDDGETAFTGGTVTRIRGGDDHFARRVVRGDALRLTKLVGLQPGTRYTVFFRIRSESGHAAGGVVGDTAGSGWRAREWAVAGTAGWHRVRVVLRATRRSEPLAIYPMRGGSSVLIDGVKVLRGRVGFARAEEVKTPTREYTSGSGPKKPSAKSLRREGKLKQPKQTTVVAAVQDTFDPSSPTGNNANLRWRLAFWRFLVRETAHDPIFGVGFGAPADFRWRGVRYDARIRKSTDPNNVTPPHNSFVDLLFRTGVLGFGAFVALVVLAVWRGARWLRRSRTDSERAVAVGLLSLLAFISVVVSLNVALEGPYMSMFFWSILAMLYVVPALTDARTGEAASRLAAGGGPE